jgi:hypothetical protein
MRDAEKLKHLKEELEKLRAEVEKTKEIVQEHQKKLGTD